MTKEARSNTDYNVSNLVIEGLFLQVKVAKLTESMRIEKVGINFLNFWLFLFVFRFFGNLEGGKDFFELGDSLEIYLFGV